MHFLSFLPSLACGSMTMSCFINPEIAGFFASSIFNVLTLMPESFGIINISYLFKKFGFLKLF